MHSRHVDPRHPADYIVFFRAGKGKEPNDWVLERTSDAAILESGTLEEMLALLQRKKYPRARRATHVEDMLRFRARIFELSWLYEGPEPPT
jgi:hypothetical protein